MKVFFYFFLVFVTKGSESVNLDECLVDTNGCFTFIVTRHKDIDFILTRVLPISVLNTQRITSGRILDYFHNCHGNAVSTFRKCDQSLNGNPFVRTNCTTVINLVKFQTFAFLPRDFVPAYSMTQIFTKLKNNPFSRFGPLVQVIIVNIVTEKRICTKIEGVSMNGVGNDIYPILITYNADEEKWRQGFLLPKATQVIRAGSFNSSNFSIQSLFHFHKNYRRHSIETQIKFEFNYDPLLTVDLQRFMEIGYNTTKGEKHQFQEIRFVNFESRIELLEGVFQKEYVYAPFNSTKPRIATCLRIETGILSFKLFLSPMDKYTWIFLSLCLFGSSIIFCQHGLEQLLLMSYLLEIIHLPPVIERKYKILLGALLSTGVVLTNGYRSFITTDIIAPRDLQRIDSIRSAIEHDLKLIYFPSDPESEILKFHSNCHRQVWGGKFTGNSPIYNSAPAFEGTIQSTWTHLYVLLKSYETSLVFESLQNMTIFGRKNYFFQGPIQNVVVPIKPKAKLKTKGITLAKFEIAPHYNITVPFNEAEFTKKFTNHTKDITRIKLIRAWIYSGLTTTHLQKPNLLEIKTQLENCTNMILLDKEKLKLLQGVDSIYVIKDEDQILIEESLNFFRVALNPPTFWISNLNLQLYFASGFNVYAHHRHSFNLEVFIKPKDSHTVRKLALVSKLTGAFVMLVIAILITLFSFIFELRKRILMLARHTLQTVYDKLVHLNCKNYLLLFKPKSHKL